MASSVNDAMTVIQLLPSLQGGGVERGVVEVSQALVAAGHRSVVVSSGGRMVSELTGHGAEHVEMPIGAKSPAVLGCLGKLKKLIRETDADIVHARSRLPAWVSYLLWQRMKKGSDPFSLVTSVHGLNSVSGYSKVMTFGQRVEVVSETVRSYVLKHYPGTPPEKLCLIHRGVDPVAFPYGYKPSDAWLADWRAVYPELEGKFVITLAGRLTRLKGHHELLHAIQHLHKHWVKAHALIVGGEDPRRQGYAQELRDTVKKLGLEEHVTFTGHRSDIKEVMAASDVVVSLSTKPESFGRSVLEALRLGVPVVGYDHGGVGEVLGTMYPQGLVPLKDTHKLAEALAEIAAERVEKPRPAEHFLLHNMLEKTLAMYQSVRPQPVG